MKRENAIYVQAAKMAAFIVVSLVLARFTRGGFAAMIALAGIFFAAGQKTGPAICCYIFLPFCVVVNPSLVPKDGMIWTLSLRLGALAIGLAMVIGALKRNGRHCLPFAGIIPFLVAATISSLVGYVPQISLLKIVNYLVFLVGIWLGTRNLQRFPKDLLTIRAFFLGLIFLLVWGSLALIPFPGISYATSLQYALKEGGLELANAMGKEMLVDGGQALFCGITNHSQALSPVLALSMGWLMCDMLFVEKRFRWPHVLTIAAMLPMLYMTRSRVALLVGASAMALIYLYTVNKVRVSRELKSRLRSGMMGFCFLAAVLAGVAEIRNQSITKWIRKTDDVAVDAAERSAMQAFTGSRQFLIEQSLYDFRRNPMFGSGFQVSWEHQELYRKSNGLILSASIEKGVLPTMVLGETGILGCITFALFLITFYATCNIKRLYITTTMFTLLLISNLGEATFFSPGGSGGVLWILTVLGGFVIDTVLLYERNSEMAARARPGPMPLPPPPMW